MLELLFVIGFFVMLMVTGNAARMTRHEKQGSQSRKKKTKNKIN